ncbi:hypothetical protein Syun_030917 [Stephania yunnanensis]|uniref:Toprim domain-containing protein n=1 Tax=Stephania yunnanensis TaxID=152371 RepID=A0AAP0DYR9_9MAGN
MDISVIIISFFFMLKHMRINDFHHPFMQGNLAELMKIQPIFKLFICRPSSCKHLEQKYSITKYSLLKEIPPVAVQNRVVIGAFRGKILNIERKDEASMYKNEEIQNLILGLGLGVKGEDFKKDALRYHKIIILTDADVDGAHIRTLLLTFFFRYQVERGKQIHYCYDDAELKKLQKTFPANASYNIQRFKGLGEMMPVQLWETTMNPETRLLKQLVVEDAAEANVVFSSLMGARVDGRKELIQNSSSMINLDSLDI